MRNQERISCQPNQMFHDLFGKYPESTSMCVQEFCYGHYLIILVIFERLLSTLIWKNLVLVSPSLTQLIRDLSFQQSSSILRILLQSDVRVCSNSCKTLLVRQWGDFRMPPSLARSSFFLCKKLPNVLVAQCLIFSAKQVVAFGKVCSFWLSRTMELKFG